MLVRFGDRAIVCIEVKLGPAETADTEKQSGYRAYLDQQTTIPTADCHAVLLVTRAEKPEYPGRFKPLLWSAVCIRLRNMLPVIRERSGVVVAAMVLAFVGAVEQNLLRFSAALVQQAVRRAPVLGSSKICEHILESLDKEVGMAGETEHQDTDPDAVLLAEGVGSYMSAMNALHQFRLEVQKTSRTVLNRRLPELVRSIGLGIEPEQMRVEEYAYPPAMVKWDGSAWLAAKFSPPDQLFQGYLGLHWRDSDGQAGVIATLASNGEVYDRLLRAVTASGIGNVSRPTGRRSRCGNGCP